MRLNAERIDRIKPSPSSMAGQRVRALRAQGRDIVGLTAGEPDFETPEHIGEAAIRAIREGKTRYTDVGGTAELRAAVAEKFRRDNGLSGSADQVIVGTGGKQVIFNALMATLNPGDEVIVAAPYWVSYPDIVLLAEGVPVFAPCPAASGFRLQPADLEKAITPRTRWLILNAPNNPSGAVYSKEQLRALADVLVRHPQVWILSDDMYEHVLYDGRRFETMASVAPELAERTLTINGVSKAYAMTGWRIGYGMGPAALIKSMVKLQSQSTSNPSSISQAAALAALTGPQDFIASRTRVFQERRDVLVDALNEIDGIRCHSPDGAFYVFPSCEGLIGRRTPTGNRINTDEDLIMHWLDSENLAVLQGAAYGMSPYFRISFATDMDTIHEALRRLRRGCESLQA